MKPFCESCWDNLTTDEIGLNLKLLGRYTRNYFCTACMAKRFKTTEAVLFEMIRMYQEEGCMLFSPPEKEDRKRDV